MGDGGGDLVQILVGAGLGGADDQEGQAGLRIALRLWLGIMVTMELIERLACSGECVALDVDQALDLQGQLDVTAAVKPLAGSALVGFELRKLRLPKAQDIGFDLSLIHIY